MNLIWKQISTFVKFVSLTKWMFSFFFPYHSLQLPIKDTEWIKSCYMHHEFPLLLYSPTYYWSITDQFSKSVNCKHFYFLCSFFISQKMNSYILSSTCGWPIYIVIPKTVCLEFMLARAQWCWAFLNSFLYLHAFWQETLFFLVNLTF